MANSMDQNGAIDRIGSMAEAIERGFTAENSDKIHNILLAGFRNVPTVTGALKRSLLQKKDRSHVWIVETKRLRFGSTLPYAYRAAESNKINSTKVAQAVADALFSTLGRQG